jgi:NAD(P)H-hydrate epimerase
MTAVEHRVYTAAQVRQLDHTAIHDAGIPAYTLMSRAGQVTFD